MKKDELRYRLRRILPCSPPPINSSHFQMQPYVARLSKTNKSSLITCRSGRIHRIQQSRTVPQNQSTILHPSQITSSEPPTSPWQNILVKKPGSRIQVDSVLCIIPYDKSLLIRIQNGTNDEHHRWKIKRDCQI